jgi:hypothetical protein
LSQIAGVQDYLVETRRTKAPLAIPKVEYFSGLEGHEARHGLTVAWSPDSRGVFVVYEEVTSYLAAVWAEPGSWRVTDLGGVLETQARRFIRESPGSMERGKWKNIYFSRVAVIEPGLLVLDLCFRPPPSLVATGESCVRLKCKISSEKWGAKLELLAGRVVHDDERKEEPEFTEEGIEVELKDLSGKLQERLAPNEKSAFRKEQDEWLKLRFVMPSAANKMGFTRRRVEELRIRLEEKSENEAAAPKRGTPVPKGRPAK